MKCVKGEDDYNGQKGFVDSLCAAATETKIHVHLIHHSKKPMDPKAPPGKYDAKGSGSITDQVDNVVSVFQLLEEGKDEIKKQRGFEGKEPPDHCFTFSKQRNAINGWEGKLVTWFDRDSLQFLSSSQEKAKVFIG